VAVADHVMILENAYYSVISPEGCAAILWKDRAFASQAADALKIEGKQLLELGVVDQIIQEPVGGAHRDWDTTASTISNSLESILFKLRKTEDLISKRYEKFRVMGKFLAN
jgi:acetyl-CoA carboxylase carboxyl transferase subunit alpha